MILNACSFIYYCNPFLNFTFLNAKVASQLSNVLSPKFYETVGTTFVPVTRVDWMNVDQTGNWVRTFANSRGWENGDDYAKSFKQQKINGLGLRYLTHKSLEIRLGVKSIKHRQEILSTVRYLYGGFPMACDCLSSVSRSFPSELESKISASESDTSTNGRNFTFSVHNDDINQCFESETDSCAKSSSSGDSSNVFSGSVYIPSRTRSNCGRESEMIGSSMPAMSSSCKSLASGEFRKKSRMYPSNYRRSHERNAGFLHMTSIKSRKLLITLDPEEDIDPELSTMRIRNRFQELNILVEDVGELEDKRNVYVVVFSDCKRAQDALIRSEDIGFKLRWLWPKTPGPSRARTFKALMPLKILSGKSLTKSKFRGWLPKGTIVKVNQLKRRRARLIKENADGNIVIIGWVNMKMENGQRCLEQLDGF